MDVIMKYNELMPNAGLQRLFRARMLCRWVRMIRMNLILCEVDEKGGS